MNSRDAIQLNLDTAAFVCNSYLADLADADLMHRPHPQCNHLNWQIGHLIASEHKMIDQIAPGTMPPLPEGFAEKYTKENASSDDPTKFCSHQELMSLAASQRAGTLNALQGFSDTDLDKPTGVDYAPTVASMLSLQGCHWLMHCGQWVIVRRTLGKPVVI